MAEDLTTPSLTMIYAAILGLGYVWLSLRVISERRRKKISLGDAGDTSLQRRVRAHGNFAEYTPLCLILIFLLEASSFDPVVIHSFGSALLLGRLVHLIGISIGRLPLRVTGMTLTFAVIVGAAVLGSGTVFLELLL